MKNKISKKSASNPFYMVFHPFDSSYDIRFKNEGIYSYTIIILLLWFLSAIMVRQNTGFIFNRNKLSDLNVFILFAKVVIPFIMWVVGNWVVSILINGTGRFKDIWIVSAYAAIPYIISTLGSVILSNMLVMNEPFAEYLLLFGTAWSLIILFVGMMVIHEYKFTENITACLFSIAVMAIILFFLVLIGNLYQEFMNFIRSIYTEILFRL
ncbi:MAG TPA: YIP1 family protein [Epulopiscium sp.]|nr:YIP1 family protein [Candidatus Epulonipiscium sp.]